MLTVSTGVKSPGALTGPLLFVSVVAVPSAGGGDEVGQSWVSSPLTLCGASSGCGEAREHFCLPDGAQPDTVRSLN